jgi:hypothetical protein
MEDLDHRVLDYMKKSRKIGAIKFSRKIGGLAQSSNKLLHKRMGKKGFRV